MPEFPNGVDPRIIAHWRQYNQQTSEAIAKAVCALATKRALFRAGIYTEEFKLSRQYGGI